VGAAAAAFAFSIPSHSFFRFANSSGFCYYVTFLLFPSLAGKQRREINNWARVWFLMDEAHPKCSLGLDM
jgi:hypothetical protein